MSPTEPNSITSSPCTVLVHNFSCQISERPIHYQVTKLAGQSMIWVGEGGNPSMASLAAGVPGTSSLASTMLLGKGDHSCMLAGRLAKKLNKQVEGLVLLFYCKER